MVLNQHPPIRLEPAPGITLLCLPDSRFKRAQMEVHFDHQIDDGRSPERTLLARLLEQGSAKHPNQMEITRAEEMLYGAEIRIDGDRLAEHHRFSLGMSWVGNKFLPEGADAEAGILALGAELLQQPLLDENGAFPADNFIREQAQLVRRIKSLKDDRASWARERFFACLCADEPYGKPPWGTAEEVEELSAADCLAALKSTLSNAPITAIAVGAIDPGKLAEWLSMFGGPRTGELPPCTTRSAPTKLREVHEHLPIDQARFLMGFRFTPPQTALDMEALSLTSSLLGGGSHSRLFRVVREELSLCYGISSSIRVNKGILTIGAGIDASSYQQVKEQSLLQIKRLAEGDFSEAELDLCKVNLLNDLDALGDSAPGLAGFIGREFYLGFNRTPAMRADLIGQITKDHICATAAGFKADLAYLLSGEEQ